MFQVNAFVLYDTHTNNKYINWRVGTTRQIWNCTIPPHCVLFNQQLPTEVIDTKMSTLIEDMSDIYLPLYSSQVYLDRIL